MPKLVSIGDSLTQGFQSLAVTHVNRSYPAMIANAMGLSPAQFRVPDFSPRGGFPLNIEWLARGLEKEFGGAIAGFEWLKAVPEIVGFLNQVEDYWEGPGMKPAKAIPFHNLAVWGFEVGDAYALTAKQCQDELPTINWPDFNPTPAKARERTGLRVLNPGRDNAWNDVTQVKLAQRIAAEEGPIEHLILWLGANNCLGTVVNLEITETGKRAPGPMSKKTLWSTSAFKEEYEELAALIARDVKPRNVYVGTVPHVTIPPITRGVMKDKGSLPGGERYYDYYTRFWIRDVDFNPLRDPHLTKGEAKKIDQRIDSYNGTIRATAKKYGWVVVDTCDLLDRLAVRRNHGNPDKSVLPPEYGDLNVRFFEASGGKVVRGGLIALDGVHPTTCGYAVIAQKFIEQMRSRMQAGETIQDINFKAIRASDALVSAPPRTLDDIFGMLSTLEQYFHLSRWMSM